MIRLLQTLLRATLADPREGAALVLSRAPKRSELFQMAVVICAIGTLLAALLELLFPLSLATSDAQINISPFTFFGLQIGGLYLLAFATHFVGKMFGGKGSFDEAVLLLIWLQAVLLIVQIAQVVFSSLGQNISSVVFTLGIGIMLWLLTSFIVTLHGFKSRIRVAMVIFATLFGLTFLLSFIIAFLGLAS